MRSPTRWASASSLGASPKWTLAERRVMPKSRYRIMARYMPKVGTRGLDMMFRTATVQANLDFSGEADMVAKLRIGLALQPTITALFANSPFTEGGPTAFSRPARRFGATPTPPRTGMMPSPSRPAWASSAMSTMRSTCRSISSSAAGSTTTSRARVSATCSPAGSPPCRASGPDLRLGQPPLDDFPRGAAQALPRDARRGRRAARPHRGAVGVFGRPLLRHGRARGRRRTDKGGARRNARRATRFRVLGSRARIAGRAERGRARCAFDRSRRPERRAGATRGRDETHYLEPLEAIVPKGERPRNIGSRATKGPGADRWRRRSAEALI